MPAGADDAVHLVEPAHRGRVRRSATRSRSRRRGRSRRRRMRAVGPAARRRSGSPGDARAPRRSRRLVRVDAVPLGLGIRRLQRPHGAAGGASEVKPAANGLDRVADAAQRLGDHVGVVERPAGCERPARHGVDVLGRARSGLRPVFSSTRREPVPGRRRSSASVCRSVVGDHVPVILLRRVQMALDLGDVLRRQAGVDATRWPRGQSSARTGTARALSSQPRRRLGRSAGPRRRRALGEQTGVQGRAQPGFDLVRGPVPRVVGGERPPGLGAPLPQARDRRAAARARPRSRPGRWWRARSARPVRRRSRCCGRPARRTAGRRPASPVGSASSWSATATSPTVASEYAQASSSGDATPRSS